jgi:hypothetical protein
MSRVVLVRSIFIFALLWAVWFLFHFAKSGSTEIFSEMMAKFSRAIDSSYDSSRLVYSAVIALGLSTYNWVDLLLPFVIDVFSLLSVAIGPVWNLVSPLALFVSRHAISGIQAINQRVEWKYKMGSFVFLLFFFRVGKFFKVFLLNLLFFLFSFDLVKTILINAFVKLAVFVILPVGLAIRDIGETNSSFRTANLIGYLSFLPVLIYCDGFAIPIDSMSAQFLLCPVWSATMSLILCINRKIRLTGIGLDGLLDDLGISVLVQRGMVPIGNRLVQTLVVKYPVVGQVPEMIASARSRIMTFGFNFSTGKYNVSSLIRGKWSLVSLIVISLILVGYFAYTALTLFVSVAVWPWFFSESYKVLKYEVVSEYKSHLSFTLVFLIYEFFLVRSNFALVSFVASMLHLPALLMLKVLSSTLVGRLVKTVRALSPAPSPVKKND